MACVQLSPPVSMEGQADRAGLRRLALAALRPLAAAHRHLLERQRLEALSDRLLRDAGLAREDLPALLRRR